MHIYLAARYGRRLELLNYASELETLGHTITSSWITGKHELNSEHGARADQVASDTERANWAEEDWADLLRADAIIAFTEGPDAPGRGRGGRHVEFGIAVARGIGLIVVGPRENIFNCMSHVEQFDTWEQCLAALAVAEPANA